MKIFDNISEIVRDDMAATIAKESKINATEIFKLLAPDTRVKVI